MATNKPVKKPLLIWPIISFAVTIMLFVVYSDSLDETWHLFVLFLGMDILSLVQYFHKKKAYARMQGLSQSQSTAAAGARALATPARITVTRESSMVGAIVAYKVYLNGSYVGDVKNGMRFSFDTAVSHNTVSFFDKYGNPFKDEVTVDLADGGTAAVFIKSGRVLTDRTRVSQAAGAQAGAIPPAAFPIGESADGALPDMPENPKRAIWMAAAALLLMLLCAVSSRLDGAYHKAVASHLLVLSHSLILGVCVYWMTQPGAKYKALSACSLLFGVAVYAISRSFMQIDGALSWGTLFEVLFESPSFAQSIQHAAILSAIVSVATIVFTSAYRGQGKKPVAVSAWVAAGAAAAFKLYTGRHVLTLPQIPITQRIGFVLSALDTGLCIALFALAAYALCTLRRRALKTGPWAKVWFSLCVILTLGTIALNIVVIEPDIASAAIAVIGVIGYILLLASRRAGYPIVLMAALMTVTAGVNTAVSNASIADGMAPLTGLFNPLITWLIIRKRWKDMA